MNNLRSFFRIILTSLKMAWQELRANKLRTFLSLLGVTIGIFCIVAVFTMLDSLEKNIRNNVATLGDDVLYINKWPWMDENGEYRWWDFLNRPVMTQEELSAVEQRAQSVRYATLCYTEGNVTAKQGQNEVSGIVAYCVTGFFEKMQNFEISEGRYFSAAELAGGNHFVVVGSEVYDELFPGGGTLPGKTITFMGQRFQVIGLLKKTGDNMAGFNFDRCVIIPYNAAAALVNVSDKNGSDPVLMVKAKSGVATDDMMYEVEGILRGQHRLAPGVKNDFAINRLSQITERLNLMFATIDIVGIIIAAFSLLVGGFGIANIMFVSVKERTKIIGLKKAIGAKRIAILSEFLIEAVTLCIIGGIIGIIMVLILGWILSGMLGFTVTLSIKNFLLGIGISTFVGVLSGFIPARSASRMDPVTAIRSN